MEKRLPRFASECGGADSSPPTDSDMAPECRGERPAMWAGPLGATVTTMHFAGGAFEELTMANASGCRVTLKRKKNTINKTE